jgi:hypothetical protein
MSLGVAQSVERNLFMIVALVVLSLMLAFVVAATLLRAKPAPAPVRVRVDDVERLRRRR